MHLVVFIQLESTTHQTHHLKHCFTRFFSNYLRICMGKKVNGNISSNSKKENTNFNQYLFFFLALALASVCVSLSVHWVAYLYYCIAWLFSKTSTYLLLDIKQHTHIQCYYISCWAVRLCECVWQLFKLFWFIIIAIYIYVYMFYPWSKDARAHTYCLFRETCLNYVFSHFDFRPWARYLI